MSKYLPTLLLILGTLAGAFAPQIEAFFSAHPTLVTVLATIVAIINLFLRPPTIELTITSEE